MKRFILTKLDENDAHYWRWTFKEGEIFLASNEDCLYRNGATSEKTGGWACFLYSTEFTEVTKNKNG